MRKRKLLIPITVLVLCLSLSSMNTVQAKESNDNYSVQNELSETADDSTESTVSSLPATFVSEPTPEQIEIMKENSGPIINDKTTRDVTPEGFHRTYGTISFDTSKINNRHKFIGQCSAYNNTSKTGTLAYMQASSKTTNWTVSSSVSGSADVSLLFLARVKATLGVTVAKSTTTSASNTATYTMKVSPKKYGYIDAYHKSGYGSGYIKWTDRLTPSGPIVRTGTTKVSGNTMVSNSVHYDAYEK